MWFSSSNLVLIRKKSQKIIKKCNFRNFRVFFRVHMKKTAKYVKLEKNLPGWSSIFSFICWVSSMTQTRYLFSGNGYSSISRLILTGSPTLWGGIFFMLAKLQWTFYIVILFWQKGHNHRKNLVVTFDGGQNLVGIGLRYLKTLVVPYRSALWIHDCEIPELRYPYWLLVVSFV